MATIDEVKALLESLTATVATLVSEQADERAKREAKDAEVVETTEAVKSAVEATRAVEEAELPKSTKDNLIEGIKEGNYNVAPRIEEVKALRAEILAEANVTIGGRTFAESGSTEDVHDVKGW